MRPRHLEFRQRLHRGDVIGKRINSRSSELDANCFVTPVLQRPHGCSRSEGVAAFGFTFTLPESSTSTATTFLAIADPLHMSTGRHSNTSSSARNANCSRPSTAMRSTHPAAGCATSIARCPQSPARPARTAPTGASHARTPVRRCETPRQNGRGGTPASFGCGLVTH